MHFISRISPTMLEFLHQYASRVEAGIIEGVDSESIYALTSISLPALRQLILADARASVPTLPCSESWPNLRTLVLDIPLFLPSTGFGNLTKLIISRPRCGTDEDIFTPADLLTFLAGCPRLQTTYFPHIGEDEPVVDWHGGPVQLAHLRRFSCTAKYASSIMVHYDRCIAFAHELLSHLSFPDTCAVRVGEVCPGDLYLFADALPVVAHGPTHIRISEVPEASGPLRETRPAVLTIRTAFDPTPEARRYAACELRVYHVNTLLAASVWNVVASVRRAFFRETVRELWLGLWTDWMLSVTPFDELSFFFSLLNLEVLIIFWNAYAEGSVERAVRSLKPTQGEDGVWGEVACPRLHTLRIDTDYMEPEEDYLLDLARGRKAAGFPIERLLVQWWYTLEAGYHLDLLPQPKSGYSGCGSLTTRSIARTPAPSPTDFGNTGWNCCRTIVKTNRRAAR